MFSQTNLIDKNNNLFTKIFNFFQKNLIWKVQVPNALEKIFQLAVDLAGSSNATSFMILLNKILSSNLNKKELQEISLNFGSWFFSKIMLQLVKVAVN